MSDTTLSVGAPAETLAGERRVALTPAVVPSLLKLGARVVIESGAGEASGFPDEAYADKGATIGSREDALGADVVAMVRVMGADPASPDLAHLRSGQAVVGMAAPMAAPEVAAAIAGRGATLFSLELVPRTTPRPVDGRAVVAGRRSPATRPCCWRPTRCPRCSRC